MDPNIDKQLASHVLRSHIYRKPGEADGEPLRMETSADVVISEDAKVGSEEILCELNCLHRNHSCRISLQSHV